MAETNKNGETILEKEILSPYTYLMQVKGKQIRPKIVFAFNHWLKVPMEKLNGIVDAVNMVYVGSLLIDDIQDHSMIRRGLPSAHRVYGLPITINAAMHVFFLAFEKMFKLDPKASTIISMQMLEVIRGQGCDIYWRDNHLCPNEEQYWHMVEQKTGRMLLMAVQTLQLFSENKTDYSNLVLLLGRYFQIRDDYCNLMYQEELEEWPEKEQVKESKDDTFCDDITEGKFSLPVIHALQTPKGEKILNILRRRTRDVNLKKYCLSLLEEAGSLQYTRDILAGLDREARMEVDRLGGNPVMETVLDKLLSWRNVSNF